MAGCEVDAKYTSANTPIPLAIKTGRLTMFLESTMTKIIMDSDEHKMRGIEYVTSSHRRTKSGAVRWCSPAARIETARQLTRQ